MPRNYNRHERALQRRDEGYTYQVNRDRGPGLVSCQVDDSKKIVKVIGIGVNRKVRK